MTFNEAVACSQGLIDTHGAKVRRCTVFSYRLKFQVPVEYGYCADFDYVKVREGLESDYAEASVQYVTTIA